MAPSYRFQGRVEKLELARGHDGLFRGPPDPVLAIGVYVGDGSSFRLIGRTLHRFRPRRRFPSEAAPDVPELASAAIDAQRPFRYVVLAIALEEDGAGDVQRLFGALEHHELLTTWSRAGEDVDPHALAQLPEGPPWTTPAQVELLVDGVSAAESCTSDKFIGAVCWTLSPQIAPPVGAPPASLFRLPFLALDGKNDWTAIVAIAH